MLKSIFQVSAPIILIIIILIIGFNTYQKTLENTDNPLSIIPSNSSVILQCNDAQNLSNLLQNTIIWEKLLSINQMQLINENIKDISTFFSKHQLIFTSNTLFISFIFSLMSCIWLILNSFSQIVIFCKKSLKF